MKHDRTLERDFVDPTPDLTLTRRELFQLVGGGILVLFTAGEAGAAAEGRPGRRGQLPEDFNAFLRIGEDGRVSCFTGKIEMGQGIVTSLAQMLAEELEVTLDSVDMVMGDTALCPWDMGTFGSMTTRFFGPPLRAAGAEAKRVLLEWAAEHLQVPVEQLAVEEGVVFDSRNRNHQVSYAQLSQGKKIERHLRPAPPPQDPSDFQVIHQPVTRRDARAKVTGQAIYAGDIRLPGMLYAKILRPPAHGARLREVEVAGAKEVPGAQVVQDGDLVAVLHSSPDEAEKARSQMKAQFDRPNREVDDRSIFDHLLKVAPEGNVVARGGSLTEGEKGASQVFETTYRNGYVAHAPLEPHTAVARVEGDQATVWASTQTPFGAREEIAQALGLAPEKVRVITPFVGGGFGGKTQNQQAVEAARLAQLTGKPVQVAWDREEEFFLDSFRPAAVVQIRSGLTDRGRIAFWDYHVYFAGQRGAEHFYDIPHHATLVHGSGWGGGPGTHPFATGPWRAPGNNTNTFARESQIDILAARAGMDPVEFRRRHLTEEKMRGVLEAAAEKFGWTPAPAPSGRGCGCACGIDAGTYVATMAEVQVDEQDGSVQVRRVVCAQDMGLAINPEGARIQMEGCISMGLGYALTEEIHFQGGEILDRNFDTYALPRFSWLPQIETILIEDPQAAPQGGGEPAIITLGGVIANALYDACGVRLLELPMTPERVKAALRER
jgi:isoquinoline 1-oxidoreductase